MFQLIRKLPKGLTWRDESTITIKSEKYAYHKIDILNKNNTLYIRLYTKRGLGFRTDIIILKEWNKYHQRDICDHAKLGGIEEAAQEFFYLYNLNKTDK